jgi:hypothetical protein
MRRLAGLLTMAVAVAFPSPAQADVAPPLNLRAYGGMNTWRTQRSYQLAWDNPAASGPPIVAIHYRVRNAAKEVVGERQIDWAPELKDTLPGIPGVYTAEVWFEDSTGEEGPPASVKLRFDNARPAQVEPIQIPPWLGRGAFPYMVRVHHPPGEAPISGIAGYAVSIDSNADGSPCTAKDQCTATEMGLAAGLGDSMLPISGLPEGTSYIHVVAVSGSGMQSVLPRHAVLQVDLTDPVTRLAGNPGNWTNKPVTLTATASDSGSGMEVGDQATSPFTALQIDGGPPKAELGASVSATLIADGVHSIAYYARDAAGNINDGSTGNGQANARPETAMVRIDRGPPSISFAKLQLPTDPELIRVQVYDALSGPQPLRGWIGVRRAGFGDSFESLATEPTLGGFRARWDSDEYPPGEYEFRATGYDMAGNASTTAFRADGSRMVMSNPLKELTSLLAGFGGRELVRRQCARSSSAARRCRRASGGEFVQRPAGRKIPFGHGILFSGRLSAGPGAPLRSMSVRVIERFGEGANLLERTTVTKTGEDGVFATRLAPGPSREVTAAFEGTATLTRSVTRPVRLGVHSDVSLQVSSAVARVGGRPLIFKGRIATDGAAIPANGKSIQLQFRLPGLPWTEFRTIQTDQQGRFRYPYRFTDDDSRGVRFRFRAYAPAQGNWPYEPGGSKPVAVWGR